MREKTQEDPHSIEDIEDWDEELIFEDSEYLGYDPEEHPIKSFIQSKLLWLRK